LSATSQEVIEIFSPILLRQIAKDIGLTVDEFVKRS